MHLEKSFKPKEYMHIIPVGGAALETIILHPCRQAKFAVDKTYFRSQV